jgi:2'-5' RNA ligase
MRLFVAIGLPDTVKQNVTALRGGIPDAKWVSQDNPHITLAFLGEISEQDIPDIALALGRIEFPAFGFTVCGVGIFGSERRPRILWAGIDGGDPIVTLQKKVIQVLDKFDLCSEARKYHPHITLARVHNSPYGKIRSFLTDHALFSAGLVKATSFALYSSHRSQSGAIYTEEVAFDLMI